jgi:hypothetical protein
MADELNSLAAELSASGLTKPGAEVVLYQLSPAQRRLFLRLSAGSADTITIRSVCSIGNVSDAVRSINVKLEQAGDCRRVVCLVRLHRNVYGERGVIGEWSLMAGGAKPVKDALKSDL